MVCYMLYTVHFFENFAYHIYIIYTLSLSTIYIYILQSMLHLIHLYTLHYMTHIVESIFSHCILYTTYGILDVTCFTL